MAEQLSALIIASHNAGKVREIDALLSPFGVSVRSAAALGLPEPEETGTTFVENALLKARAAAAAGGLPALADDSGLSVRVLGGAPGIYSARWAGENKDFGLAMDKVRELVAEFEDWHASFHCALALAWPDGAERVYEGQVDGVLTFPPAGDKGFGYDPIFRPEGYTVTFGEMDPAEKHKISHRAQAFSRLVADLFAG